MEDLRWPKTPGINRALKQLEADPGLRTTLKPESPEWHAERATFWRIETQRREARLVEAREELDAARSAWVHHTDKMRI